MPRTKKDFTKCKYFDGTGCMKYCFCDIDDCDNFTPEELEKDICIKHPDYKAERQPRCECRKCWGIYIKKLRKRIAEEF